MLPQLGILVNLDDLAHSGQQARGHAVLDDGVAACICSISHHLQAERSFLSHLGKLSRPLGTCWASAQGTSSRAEAMAGFVSFRSASLRTLH